MKIFFRVATATALVGALALTLSGCAGGGGSDTLRIGVEAPLSGDQSVTGVGMINGAQIAADEINAAGGVNGKKIEIVAIDDAADPDTGVAAAEAAIAEGLDGVVGPYNSGVGIKTLPLYQAAGVLPIRLTSNSKTNAMGFTLQPMDYQIAPVAATGLEKWLGAKSVAIIYDDSAEYTKSIATTLKSQLEADGLTVPVFTAITPGEADYSAAVMSASQAGVDVIYGATYFPEGSLLAQAIHTLQVAQPCVLDYGSYDPGYITNAGSVEVAMACTLVGVPSPTDFVKGAGFVADYTEMFGEAPGTWSPYTYDSVKLLADAMTSTKGSDVAALTDYLNKVVNWQGATGSVTIDPANGNREPATVVFLSVTPAGEFHVNHDWATAVGAPF
jgi:branched-chain amino acid transport system substrate-binding protein